MKARGSTLIAWLIVLVLFVVAGLLLQRDVRVFHSAVAGSMQLDKPAPDAITLALGGTSRRISSFEGHPLWLNFFETWCVPCKTEMPAIEQQYQRYHRDGLEVVGVDEQESAELVTRFSRKYRLSFPLVIDPGPAGEKYRVQAIPTSVFIDRSGIIRAVHIGQMSAQQMRSDLAQILPALD